MLTLPIATHNERPGHVGPLVVLAVTCMLGAAPATHAAAYSFESGEFLARPAHWPAWSDMLARHEGELEAIEACLSDKDTCPRRAKSLNVIIGRGAALARDKQIQLVNRYVNKKGYESDRRRTIESYEGKKVLMSHWATLLEFLRDGGDCEDFATAKYFLLRRLGLAPEDMRIVVVYDRQYRQYHAVLAVRHDAETTWLLETDNHIYRTRKPGAYRYVYAVNELGIWDHEKKNKR